MFRHLLVNLSMLNVPFSNVHTISVFEVAVHMFLEECPFVGCGTVWSCENRHFGGTCRLYLHRTQEVTVCARLWNV
jgi:hypothetical protein